MPPDEGAGSPLAWLRYAEADMEMAQVPLPKAGMREQLCFHAQQAAEKALKAVLVDLGIDFPRTHDIRALLDRLPPAMSFGNDVAEATRLTAYAVAARYPGEEEPIDEPEYLEAIRLAQAVLAWATGQVVE